jgi:hypothetical protein
VARFSARPVDVHTAARLMRHARRLMRHARRLMRHARRLILRIPQIWPWTHEFADAFNRVPAISQAEVPF